VRELKQAHGGASELFCTDDRSEFAHATPVENICQKHQEMV
jgi:hypothetical protein